MSLPPDYYDSFFDWKLHPNGGIIALIPLTFGRTRIVIYSADDPYTVENGW